ncbi:MAG: cytochrome c biogenesis protein CcsA [Promethearchaeota archaeon]
MIDLGFGILDLDLGTILLVISIIAFVLDYLFIFFGEYIEKWEVYSEITIVAGSTTFITSFFYFSYAVLTGDYSFEYVYRYVSNDMDTVMRMSSIWSGLAGSYFFWCFIALLSYLVFRFFFREFGHETIIWRAFMIVTAQIAGLIGLTLLNDPFKYHPNSPNDGRGLNPLLMNIWNTVHPPIIFIGYALCLVPTAIAIARITTLKDGKIPEYEGKKQLAKYFEFNVSLAWLILSSGIIIGGYWAYVTLGWGGFWAWDPVETVSLIPWLFLTLFYHGKAFYRKDKYLENYIISMTYTGVLFATFLTRSDILSSVHSFDPNDSIILLIGILLATFLLPHIYGIKNKDIFKINLALYKEDFRVSKSRTTALKISYLAGLTGTYAIIIGLLFPVFYESFIEFFPFISDNVDRKINVGPSFYNTIMTIFGGIMLVAGYFCTFFTDMSIKKKTSLISSGLIAGIAFVIGGWGGLEYTLNEENFTPEFLNGIWQILDRILFLLENFWTNGDKANLAIPLIFIAVIGVLMRFVKIMAFETNDVFRKTSQVMLHLSFLIIMLGALLSANLTVTDDIELAQVGGEYKIEGTSITIQIIDMDVTEFETGRTLGHYDTKFLLYSGTSGLGAGITRLSINSVWGADHEVTIISTLFSDIYIVTDQVYHDRVSGQFAAVDLHIKYIPYINILWAGCFILHIAILPLTIKKFIDFRETLNFKKEKLDGKESEDKKKVSNMD